KFGDRAGEALDDGDDDPIDGFTAYEARLPQNPNADNLYHPFRNKLNWDVAAWAKTQGIGANALTALLKIEGLRDGLGLQFRNNRDLNRLIDKNLPTRATFTRRSYTLGGETHDMYMRNSLDVLKELYGRPDFVRYLTFSPEKHYLLEKDSRSSRWVATPGQSCPLGL
ncbi:hypothetical protein PENSPDRAFT_672115, partial [Peniophora sp. CONT]